jgi:hypothetical protein
MPENFPVDRRFRRLITLPGHARRERNRLYRAYSQDWLAWAPEHIGTFPAFDEWLAALRDLAESTS